MISQGAYEIQAFCLGHTAFATSTAFAQAQGGDAASMLLVSGEWCMMPLAVFATRRVLLARCGEGFR